MSRNTICPSCQMGDHKHHYRTVQHAPEGGVGGAVCTCDGECEDGRYMGRTVGWLRELRPHYDKLRNTA